ncbi:iron-sulfur cluster assembly scaffold protein [Adlercreutzia equolifaciens]|uniref:iron-sulfur cluster assembly scaffold protein n=1 Tax=Adlercreutzia equolifaciens TaxID=446660 RepID=UPI0023B20227|nr:iron-sulfur cluster assembly scaffold protein [Adlercreutzia equolifaciens]MDE8702994.1 iron-sulfur cluster assembly scaffold protein [Adlercreutzia equolifaciens]
MGIRIDDPSIELRAKHPHYRGFDLLQGGKTPEMLATAAGENPFCGDELEVRLALCRAEAGEWRIAQAAFDGYGCTLCLAAADAVIEYVTGRSVDEAAAVDFERTCALLGGLEVGRTRKGCVDLAARVLRVALDEARETCLLAGPPSVDIYAKSAGMPGEKAVDRRLASLSY